MSIKATGLVRRIDDLGRVVIPKEIRRVMRIHEGEPLELFTSPDGLLIRKYRLLAMESPMIINFPKIIMRQFKGMEYCRIVDFDNVIASSNYKEVRKEINRSFSDLLRKGHYSRHEPVTLTGSNRQSVIANGNTKEVEDKNYQIISNIIIDADIIGGIVVSCEPKMAVANAIASQIKVFTELLDTELTP